MPARGAAAATDAGRGSSAVCQRACRMQRPSSRGFPGTTVGRPNGRGRGRLRARSSLEQGDRQVISEPRASRPGACQRPRRPDVDLGRSRLAVGCAPDRRLGPVPELQLAQDGGDMKLDGIRRAAERLGNLFVRLAFAQQAEHFELPMAQARVAERYGPYCLSRSGSGLRCHDPSACQSIEK